ncbi:MarR family winged helix-turn-helix transcriptional regulator [Cellulosimicrobium marinum]|uniref:MarR family winged helix-turn-helix transcriptional regulator n=1 Tax=Cellulosimicrobium marinum TaxID=1638992 RepID=UPI001E5A156D|nr:MarR family winged helix-turn-helix transcriptional regulator [Cellulosimicrobium marinum]MCB7135482.1 MarR family winged helix-turn-helix transcriptional regulator [Cellulosimicrobium marinum]
MHGQTAPHATGSDTGPALVDPAAVDPGTGFADPASRNPDEWPTGRILFAVARRIEREWNAHLAHWDLNHAGFPVLMHLLAGPRSQRALAAESGVTEQTMSRIVARLERSGYVSRTGDPDDRRRRAVAITDTGRLAGLAAARRRPAEELVTRGLDEDQVEALRGLLLSMLEHWPRTPDDEG